MRNEAKSLLCARTARVEYLEVAGHSSCMFSSRDKKRLSNRTRFVSFIP